MPKDAGVRISKDGRGRWMDNVFVERLRRSLKYECVYLHALETGSEIRRGLAEWIGFYNAIRHHSARGGRAPDEMYDSVPRPKQRDRPSQGDQAKQPPGAQGWEKAEDEGQNDKNDGRQEAPVTSVGQA